MESSGIIKQASLALALLCASVGVSRASEMASEASVCPAARVSVTQSPKEAALTRDKSFAQLSGYASESPSGPSGPGRLAGLYEGGMSLRFAFDSAPAESGGGYCVTAVRVRVIWAPTIQIASEIPEGSCAYKAALDHEREHQREHPIAANRALAEALDKEPISPSLPLAQNPKQASEMGLKRLEAFGQRLADAMDEAAQRSQRELDTPQEYERVSSACAAGERLKDLVSASRYR